MGLPLSGLLLISLFVMPVLSRQNFQRPVPNSPKGFAKQYKSVFKAYENTDPLKLRKNGEELEARFRTFAMPEHWFTEVFGPEEGPKFAREYRELFEGFASATIDEFSSAESFYTGWGKAQIKTTALTTNPELRLVRSTPTSLVPLPPVQRFRVKYFTGLYFEIGENGCIQIIARGYGRSRADSFVYVNGAFRFIGRGACPFGAACSTNKQLSSPRSTH
jgi:hypothetical protein